MQATLASPCQYLGRGQEGEGRDGGGNEEREKSEEYKKEHKGSQNSNIPRNP